ncbi:MAG: DinB family protein, partial [Thermoleophilia bacterium]|nr:DinB family protein [Thermoleophilia bacterium]
MTSTMDRPIRALESRFREVRSTTEQLVEGLSAEDCAVQSMTDASPAKWHLAHTSWFFETFVVARERPGYRSRLPQAKVLFNSTTTWWAS